MRLFVFLLNKQVVSQKQIQMKNANMDFDSMKVLKHFNPLFQLCFRAIPSIVEGDQQQSSHRDNIKIGNKHQQQHHHQQHNQYSYILITKPETNLPQKAFQCKRICPIFNHKSQSYILVKGDNLWDYYKSKKLKQLIFTQDQIWVFMKQIVQALIELAQYGIYHSHLKQYAIYRMGPYSYQLLYHNWMKSMVQLAQSNQYYWYDFYMSPEQLAVNMGGKNGKNKGMNSNNRSHHQNFDDSHQQHNNHLQQHNPLQNQKHTIFSLGLMLLNMMNLQHFNKSFYKKQKLDIDWSVVKQKINNSKLKYSTTLISVIENCLLPSIEHRVTLKQLYSSIVNHQSQFLIIKDKYKLRVDQLLINNNNNNRQRFNYKHSIGQQMIMTDSNRENSLYSSKQKKGGNSTNSSGKKTQSSQKHSHVKVNGNKGKISSSIQKDHDESNQDEQKFNVVKKWSTSLLTNRQQQGQQRQKHLKQRQKHLKQRQKHVKQRQQKYSIATTRQKSKQTINRKTNKLSSILKQNSNNQSHHHHNNSQQQPQQQIINFDRGTFGGYGDDLHNKNLLTLSKHAQQKGGETVTKANKTTTKISTKNITVQNHNNQQNQQQKGILNNSNNNNQTKHTNTDHIKIETQNVDNSYSNSNDNNYNNSNNNDNDYNNNTNNDYNNNEHNYQNINKVSSAAINQQQQQYSYKLDKSTKIPTNKYSNFNQQQQEYQIKTNEDQILTQNQKIKQEQIFSKDKLVTFSSYQYLNHDLEDNIIKNHQYIPIKINPIKATHKQINNQQLLPKKQRKNNNFQQQQLQQYQYQSPLKQKQKLKHQQKTTKLITIQDLKLKQLDFMQSQKQIQNFKSLIKNNQKPITLKLQSCLLPIQTLQQSITNQPGIYIEGNLYYGPFKSGRRNGFGLQIFPQNQYYYGQFKDDLFHGQGFYYWNKNQYFLGIFQNGTKTFGTLISPKIHYTGQFQNSKKMNGIGTQRIKTGEIYTGQWKQGKKHGIGQLIEITNDKFIGQWENNKKSGYGEYIITNYPQQGFKIKAIWYKNEIISDTIVQYSNGNLYQGPLNNDFQKHGKGLYRFKKGGYFKGTFYNDNPTHGQLVYKNGQKYIGSLRNMKRHGFGEYHYSDGTIKKGNWIDDVRVEKDPGYNY